MRKRALEWGLIAVLPLYWIGSEFFYARSKLPSGVSKISDFYQRFGLPTHVRQLQREGVTHYELSGRLPRLPWMLAFPSSPPAYVFDESGRFVEWCSDPGDSGRYQQRWPQADGRSLDPVTFMKEHDH